MLRVKSLVLAAVLLSAATGPARADDPKPAPDAPAGAKTVENVSDERAKDALERFRREYENEDLDLRLDAVARLRRVIHPTVVTELFDLVSKAPDLPVRTAAFKGLALQKPSAKVIGPRVAKFLGEAAEENRKLKARGTYGLKLDPKTGEVDSESQEGKAALRTKRERGAMLAEAVCVLDTLEHRERDSVEVLTEFLTDGNDDLVAFVLGMFGKWKEWSVLPDLLDLFEMYPEEDKYNTGSVTVDTGAAGSADQQAAKRKWMAKYGDPDRRRPRPKVVKALKKALLDITGESFGTPQELREYMKKPEVKRKLKAAR